MRGWRRASVQVCGWTSYTASLHSRMPSSNGARWARRCISAAVWAQNGASGQAGERPRRSGSSSGYRRQGAGLPDSAGKQPTSEGLCHDRCLKAPDERPSGVPIRATNKNGWLVGWAGAVVGEGRAERRTRGIGATVAITGTHPIQRKQDSHRRRRPGLRRVAERGSRL